ncbi:nucleoside-diphosphate kinase [Candidatus Roizmanbacteria bacterium RIFCSPLOWO2_02_FULL_36_11]|uniref:nucleoside-diphosphate kinase n=1 Tax=Candidatus Roizmanbacteria bacterium RIFCSPLOWO2_02_FULL_36_11 TaxID=1802071 RepID=A0A1F7JIF3_9BACT|nr:MAG: nucleoside-diphosphate kinase [Candidatus Roizmanbacteria bacterium RIFCSPLOWO2_02_FULL_36_11]
MKQQTLIVLKPDAVARGLIGEILHRFERVGLKVIAARMVKVDKSLANKHYPEDRIEFIKGMGEKTLENYRTLGKSAVEEFGHEDPEKIGKIIRGWLVEMISSGPVFAAVLEGPHAVELVRKMCGHTLPFKAVPGTIRADYSYDSAAVANLSRRPIKNLIHASGTLEEARYEVALWFSESELYSYKRTDEEVMK